MEQDKWEYNFKVVSDIEFDANLVVKANNQLFKLVLQQSLKKLRKQVPDQHTSTLAESKNICFDTVNIPPIYNKLLKNAFNKLFWKVALAVKDDGIVCINFNVYRCEYKKIEDVWFIKAFINGKYFREQVGGKHGKHK